MQALDQALPLGAMQLFQADAPTPVPVSSTPGYQGIPPPPSATSPPLGMGSLSTLDEPIWHTIRRDLNRIWKNLVLVVFPFKDRSQQSAALRNWDLWGPMVGDAVSAASAVCGAVHAAPTWLGCSCIALQRPARHRAVNDVAAWAQDEELLAAWCPAGVCADVGNRAVLGGARPGLNSVLGGWLLPVASCRCTHHVHTWSPVSKQHTAPPRVP